MIREEKGVREVPVLVRKTVCDVCGETVAKGTVKMRVLVEREHEDLYSSQPGSLQALDVCSTSCLTSTGLSLLLNGKIIPAVPEDSKSEELKAEAKCLEPGYARNFWERCKAVWNMRFPQVY